MQANGLALLNLDNRTGGDLSRAASDQMNANTRTDAVAPIAGVGSRAPRWAVRALILAPLLWLPTTVHALTCDDEITHNAGLCVQQTGLDNAATCRRQAVQNCQCDAATNQCGGGGLCDAAKQAEAKINVDWVFANAGARATYEAHRQMGETAFDAVLNAQAHNPAVQALLRQCRAWVVVYVNQPGGCALDANKPGPEQCRCISVVPTGAFDLTGTPIYQVTNACPAGMKVNVQFTDAAPRTGGFSSWGQPILTCPGRPYQVRAPQTYAIPSISAIGLQSAGGSYTCVCRDGLCS